MMKRSLILLFSCLSLININGENFLKAYNNESEKKLIVLILEENGEVIEKFKNEEQVNYHKLGIKNYNEFVRELSSELMTNFSVVEFKTADEIAEIPIEERLTYNYLTFGKMTTISTGNYSNFFQTIETDKKNDFLSAIRKIEIKEITFGFYKIEFLGPVTSKGELKTYKDGSKRTRVFYSAHLPEAIPSKWAMVSALRSINYEVGLGRAVYIPEKKYIPKFKEKTLLICRDHLDEKILETDIKGLYSGKYKIVSSEEFTNLIIGKDKEYCYIFPTPYMIGSTGSGPGINGQSAMYANQVFDNETGKLDYLLFSQSIGAFLSGTYKTIEEKSFNKLQKAIK